MGTADASQVETGNPFMLYKDSANRKSNQQNLGTIKSSNLCTGGAAQLRCDAAADLLGRPKYPTPPWHYHSATSYPVLQKSSSTARRRRLQCATWRPLRCLALCVRLSHTGGRARSSWAAWMRPTGKAGLAATPGRLCFVRAAARGDQDPSPPAPLYPAL